MCLVIDICCIALVFDGQSKQHAKFVPVLEWINGKGLMVYGGTKYNTELGKAKKFLPYVAELSRRRRTVQVPNGEVDQIATALKQKVPDPLFNDEHLVALVIASRCCVVCTNDNTAIAYLKRSDLFADYNGAGRPKVFRGHKKHKELCCDKHIVGACLQ
jgi:hypothetical protein